MYFNTNTVFIFVFFQELAVSTRTSVCQVLAPTEELAALCPGEASPVRVPLVTPVLAALMTQTNVQPRHLFAKMKAGVSTLQAPTSEIFIKAYEKCDSALWQDWWN